MLLRRVFQVCCRNKSTSTLTPSSTSTSNNYNNNNPIVKETFTLTDEQVRKYYKYFKIADYPISAPEENKFQDAKKKWIRKSKIEQLSIRNVIENIIIDLNKNKTIEFKQEFNKTVRLIKSSSLLEYWKNIHLGFYGDKKSKTFRLPTLQSTLYYYCYKNTENMNKGINKFKQYDELSKNWKKLSDEEKEKWLFEYADLELQGYRIIDYKLVKLDEEFEIQKRRSPQGVLQSKTSMFETMIIKHNLTTGEVQIDGININDGANYFIWKNLNLNFESNLYLHQRYIKLIEKWNSMSKDEQKLYQDKYYNCLKNGKILLNGELKDIDARLFREYELPYIKYIPRWGDFIGFMHKREEMAPLQVVRNQMVGNYIPALPIGYNFARQYYVGKKIQELGIDKVDKIYKEWDYLMEQEERNKIMKEYEQLIIEGKDLLNGKVVNIEEKLYQSNENYTIYEVFGQGIAKSKHNPLLFRRVTVLPAILDQNTQKGIIVDDVDPDIVFNYYFGLRFRTIKNTQQIFQEWIDMTEQQKQEITNEYKELLRRGKDMLYGEIVSLKDKQEAAKKLTKVVGRGVPLEFYKQDPEEQILTNDDVFEYFKYYKLSENHKEREIQSQWDNLNQEQKDEFKDAYELLLLIGKAIQNGKLVDI